MEKINCYKIDDNMTGKIAEVLTEVEFKMLKTGMLKGIVAFAEQTPAAHLLYQKQDESILSLEWIYVKEEYRRQGIGTELMHYFCKTVLKQENADLIFCFESVGENSVFYSFLRKIPGIYIEEEEGFEAQVLKEDISDMCNKYIKQNVQPKLYFEQSKFLRGEFVKNLGKEYPLIAWEMEHDVIHFRTDLSCCMIGEEGIEAVCLIKEQGEKMELSFLYAKPKKGAIAAKVLLDSAVLFCRQQIPELYISVVHENSLKILQHLCPEYKVVKKLYTAYYVGREI